MLRISTALRATTSRSTRVRVASSKCVVPNRPRRAPAAPVRKPQRSTVVFSKTPALSERDNSHDEELKAAFKLLDRDRNGQISAAELLQMMLNLGGSEEEVAAMIEEADTDGDGQLSYDEFVSIMLAPQKE